MEAIFTTHKTKSSRWYQEPWVWLVLGVPIIAIVSSIYLATLAFDGADKVIAPDYYKRGLAINKDIRRDITAQERQLAADFQVDAVTQAITLRLAGKGAMPPSLSLDIFRAVGNGAEEIVLKATLVEAGPGLYRGKLPLADERKGAEPALWQVNLEASDWRLSSGWYGLIHDPVALKANR